MRLLVCFLVSVALASGQNIDSCASAACGSVPPKFRAVSGVLIQACQEAGYQSCGIHKVSAFNAGHCWKLCEELTNVCRLFAFNSDSKHCIIYDQDFYSSWTTADTGDAKWTSYYRSNPDGWKLLYKISKGIGVDATDALLVGPSTPRATESMMAQDNSCNCYLKNAIVDNWSKFPITQVAVNLATAGSTVKQLLFSSVGETASTFFQQKNIIKTSWTDLTAKSPVWFMSLTPQPNKGGRAFLIVKNQYAGCPTDVGWLSVFSRGDPPCAYDATPAPSIAYTTGATADIIQGKTAYADALLIYAKM